MAKIMVFKYFHCTSPLHEMDGRIKLLCMVSLSLSASFAANVPALLILTAALTATLLISKLPVRALLKELKYFSVLLTLVIVINALTVDLIAGSLLAWRLVLIIMICVVITGTTTLRTLRTAVEWYLRPLPFIPSARVATMVTLTLALVPVLLDQITEMAQAQKARCVDERKNPFQRIFLLISPFFGQAFRKTEELITAMEARSYSEKRTVALFVTRSVDWVFLILSVAILVLILCY